MSENHEEQPSENNKAADRPLECSECKKPIQVFYTEIVGSSCTRTVMCADCPELQRRLHGAASRAPIGAQENVTAGLACGTCGTALNSLRVGVPLGCSNCYDVFDDLLLGEILSSQKIPERLATVKKSIPIHIGRAPGEIQEMNPSLRLLALNEALNETLKREDYEQAAWLRDQIKALTEPPEKKQHEQQ